jgi:anti-sigma B factor antagonist
MKVKFGESGDTAFVNLTGNLDLNTSDELRQELRSLIDTTKAKHIIIDVSEVGQVDSTGLSIIVEALRKSRDKQIDLALTGIQGSLKNVLNRTKLDTFVLEK